MPPKLKAAEEIISQEMKYKAMAKNQGVVSVKGALNIDEIKATLFSALHAGSGNKALLEDEKMFLDELLFNKDYSELNDFMQNFLLFLEFFPVRNEDEDKELYKNISEAFSTYFKFCKQLKELKSTTVGRTTDQISDLEKSKFEAKLELDKFELKLKERTNEKLRAFTNEQKLALIVAKYTIALMLDDNTHSFALINSKKELTGNRADVTKLLHEFNKSPEIINMMNGYLEACYRLINEELKKNDDEMLHLSEIVFKYLTEIDLGERSKQLIFEFFLNIEAVVQEQIINTRGEFIDSVSKKRKIPSNLEEIEKTLRLGIQHLVRESRRNKANIKVSDLNYGIFFNKEPLTRGETYKEKYAEIISDAREKAIEKFKLRPYRYIREAEWEIEKEKIIDRHNKLIQALRAIDDSMEGENMKSEFKLLRNSLINQIISIENEIKELEYIELAVPSIDILFEKLKSKEEKFYGLCKEVAGFYNIINTTKEAQLEFDTIFGEDIEFITKLVELKRTESSGNTVRSESSDILLKILEGKTYENAKSEVSELDIDQTQFSLPYDGQEESQGDYPEPTNPLTEDNVLSLAKASELKTPHGKGGGRKPKHCKNTGIKKEILGKERCIYKIQGDRKEYITYKGVLVTVKEYKELRKKPTKPKKEEKPTKPKPKSKPKKEEKPTKPKSKSKPKKEEKPTKPKSKAKPKKEEKPTKPKSKSKPKKEEKPTKAKSKSTKNKSI